MKAKKLLLAALVIIISANSFAQVTYQGNSLDSNSRITLVPASQTDTAPATDSVPALASDSAHADTMATQASSPQAGSKADQPMIIFEWDDEKTNYLIGFMALALFLLITGFKESIAAFIKSGALKVKIRPRKERLQTTLEEEQILTKIHEEKVKRKANTMTKLGMAVSKVLGDIFKEKPKWTEWRSVLRFVIPFFVWLLEGLLFFRWLTFRRLLWAMGFVVILFGIWALKPAPIQEAPCPPTEPQPVITPTVAIVEDVEYEEEEVDPHVGRPDEHPTTPVHLGGPDEGYLDAPMGRYGKTLVKATGYDYFFLPEDSVSGLPEPNNPNSNAVPFPDGPKAKPVVRHFNSVAWTSRAGYDTKVKWWRKWRGPTGV